MPKPPPKRVVLHECAECADLQQAFSEYEWRALPSAVIEAHANSLLLLSPEALVHYLPAYLLYALDHFEPHALPTEMTSYTLTPLTEDEEDEGRAEWRRAKLKAFTHEQIMVVADFLDLVEADERGLEGLQLMRLSLGSSTRHPSWG